MRDMESKSQDEDVENRRIFAPAVPPQDGNSQQEVLCEGKVEGEYQDSGDEDESDYGDQGMGHNVLGITVANYDQKWKLERLLRLAILWLIFVCIDHTANLVHILVNADSLQACRKANSFTHTEDIDTTAFRSVMTLLYIFSFGVAISVPITAYMGAKRRRRSYIAMIRIFALLLSLASFALMIQHFTLSVSNAANEQSYEQRMHTNCAQLSRNAGQLYMVFGFLAMLLGCTQCAMFVTSQRILAEVDFWYIRAEVLPQPISIEGQAVQHAAPNNESSTRRIARPSMSVTENGFVVENYDEPGLHRPTQILPVSPPEMESALSVSELSHNENIPIARSISVVAVSST